MSHAHVDHDLPRDEGDEPKHSKHHTHHGPELRTQPAEDRSAREYFRKIASTVATAMGKPWAFVIAVLVVVGWAVMGPIFGFSDTWQLVINTSTTIVTFLMVFLIQNTQNRDSRAIHIKLDELLRALTGARTRLVDLEDATDEEIEHLQHQFEQLRKKKNGTHDKA